MENSPEYRTIIELTPELTNAFKSDLISLSGEFLSAGFINNGNAGNLRNEHNNAEGRAADLVSWITDKIQLEPKGNYRAFIDVLKRRLADHKSILRRLDEKYKELSGKVETGISAAQADGSSKASDLNSASRERVKEDFSDVNPGPEDQGPDGQGPSKLTVAILVLLVFSGICAVGWSVYAITTLHAPGPRSESAQTVSTNAETVRNRETNSMGSHSKGDDIRKLNDLIQAVKEIGNWRGLCTNLGVNEGVMDRLKYSTDTVDAKKADCLQAYFNSGQAKWSDVVKAVAMHPIDNIRVAEQIAEDHGLSYSNIVKDEL